MNSMINQAIIIWSCENNGIEIINNKIRQIYSKETAYIQYALSLAKNILKNFYEFINCEINQEYITKFKGNISFLERIRPKSLSQNIYCVIPRFKEKKNKIPYDTEKLINIKIMVYNYMKVYYETIIEDIIEHEKKERKFMTDYLIKDSCMIAKLSLLKRNYCESCACCLESLKGKFDNITIFHPCGHSICKDCLKGLMQSHHVYYVNYDGIHGFPCHICRTNVTRAFYCKNIKLDNELISLITRNVKCILHSEYIPFIDNKLDLTFNNIFIDFDLESILNIIKQPLPNAELDISEIVINNINQMKKDKISKNNKYIKCIEIFFDEIIKHFKQSISKLLYQEIGIFTNLKDKIDINEIMKDLPTWIDIKHKIDQIELNNINSFMVSDIISLVKIIIEPKQKHKIFKRSTLYNSLSQLAIAIKQAQNPELDISNEVIQSLELMKNKKSNIEIVNIEKAIKYTKVRFDISLY